MRTQVNLSACNHGEPTIDQLYKSIALLTSHIVEDHLKCNNAYPVGVHFIQLVTLKALIKEVETYH